MERMVPASIGTLPYRQVGKGKREEETRLSTGRGGYQLIDINGCPGPLCTELPISTYYRQSGRYEGTVCPPDFGAGRMIFSPSTVRWRKDKAPPVIHNGDSNALKKICKEQIAVSQYPR